METVGSILQKANLPRNLQQSTTTSQVARINRTLVELGQNGHGQISIYQNQPPAKRMR